MSRTITKEEWRQAQVSTEAQLQAHVRRLCKDLDLAHFHPAYSMGNEPGYPDSTIVGPGGVVWAELKGPRGKLSPHQLVWRDRILESGNRWYLWTPADLDEIQDVLLVLSLRRPPQ